MAPDAAGAVVEELEALWRQRSLANDIPGILALYAEDALFFGSLPAMFVGRQGVADYFASVPLDAAREIAFFGREVRPLGEHAIASASCVFFDLELEGRPVRWRFGISWTLVRQGNRWVIASHHASPRES